MCQSEAAVTAREVVSVLPRILMEEPALKYEIYAILEEHFPPKEEFNRILEEIEKSRIETNKRFAEAREESNRRFEAIDKRFAEAREESNRRFEAIDKRFEAVDRRFDAADKRFDKIEATLGTVQKTVEKLTLDIEEEAREVGNYKLREKNIDIELDRFEIPQVIEIDIYGCNDELCVIGECSVRAGVSILDKLERDMKKLKESAPEKIKGKVIKLIYTSLPVGDLIEEAKKKNVWVLRREKEVTDLVIDTT
ncbi:MAG: hypothetical protein GW770_04780 [Candidatus Altiarchaeum hamiconexum]|nr:hypothetical protein [Candidatus Altarchaeum hamiconexum]